MDTLVKAWGIDRTLYTSDAVELHLLSMEKGGFTSHHLHRVRASYLRVIDGVLRVTMVHGKYRTARILEIGQDISIPANAIHQLEAITNCTLIELYTPNVEGDIERLDDGGFK